MGEREDKATNNREQRAIGGESLFLEKRTKKQNVQNVSNHHHWRGTIVLGNTSEFIYLYLMTPGDGDDRNNSGGDPAQGADRRVGGAPTGEENILS